MQVYFPGYGWLDFDTTVGNEDAEQSPQPDGTPPLQPPRAWLAADGIVSDVDTLKKLLTMKVKHMVFHDKEYKLDSAATMVMDMKIAAIYVDSRAMTAVRVARLSSAGVAFQTLEVTRPDLETVFLTLTGRSLRD